MKITKALLPFVLVGAVVGCGQEGGAVKEKEAGAIKELEKGKQFIGKADYDTAILCFNGAIRLRLQRGRESLFAIEM